MATSINIKNPSNLNTLKVTVQISKKSKDKIHWEDKMVDRFIGPGLAADVWIENGQSRVLVEELPS